MILAVSGSLSGSARMFYLRSRAAPLKSAPEAAFCAVLPAERKVRRVRCPKSLVLSVSQTEVDPDGANTSVGWKGSVQAKASLVGKKSSPKVGKEHASDEPNASSLVGEQFDTAMRYDRDTVVTYLDSQAEKLHHLVEVRRLRRDGVDGALESLKSPRPHHRHHLILCFVRGHLAQGRLALTVHLCQLRQALDGHLRFLHRQLEGVLAGPVFHKIWRWFRTERRP